METKGGTTPVRPSTSSSGSSRCSARPTCRQAPRAASAGQRASARCQEGGRVHGGRCSSAAGEESKRQGAHQHVALAEQLQRHSVAQRPLAGLAAAARHGHEPQPGLMGSGRWEAVGVPPPRRDSKAWYSPEGEVPDLQASKQLGAPAAAATWTQAAAQAQAATEGKPLRCRRHGLERWVSVGAARACSRQALELLRHIRRVRHQVDDPGAVLPLQQPPRCSVAR